VPAKPPQSAKLCSLHCKMFSYFASIQHVCSRSWLGMLTMPLMLVLTANIKPASLTLKVFSQKMENLFNKTASVCCLQPTLFVTI
jgi:hypothetical protein